MQQAREQRRGLTLEDRVQIAVGIKQGLGDREIGELIGRARSVVWRERRRNSWKTTGYKPVAADTKARRPGHKPVRSILILYSRRGCEQI